MHNSDLTALPFGSSEGMVRVLAVGWLEPGYPYLRGEVSVEFVRKLVELLVNPWQPGITLGRYRCGFCRLSGGPCSFGFRDLSLKTEVRIGSSNVWVPAKGLIYVAPSLILHYMDAHEYSPPEEFQQAVMACPPMRSIDYLKAMVEVGANKLLDLNR